MRRVSAVTARHPVAISPGSAGPALGPVAWTGRSRSGAVALGRRSGEDHLETVLRGDISRSWNGTPVPRPTPATRRTRQKPCSELQICQAAYRNRTDDLRITRRITVVHDCLPVTSRPGRALVRGRRFHPRPSSAGVVVSTGVSKTVVDGLPLPGVWADVGAASGHGENQASLRRIH